MATGSKTKSDKSRNAFEGLKHNLLGYFGKKEKSSEPQAAQASRENVIFVTMRTVFSSPHGAQ